MVASPAGSAGDVPGTAVPLLGSRQPVGLPESLHRPESSVPSYDRDRITHLEERLADPPRQGIGPAAEELEMLADLYLQADSHLPALETIERLLGLPEARALSPARRAALETKAISCRLAAGDTMAALAQCREVLVNEAAIDSLPVRARLHLRT